MSLRALDLFCCAGGATAAGCGAGGCMMARRSTWTSRARSLARRGWGVDRIAAACGVWPPRVRREWPNWTVWGNEIPRARFHNTVGCEAP